MFKKKYRIVIKSDGWYVAQFKYACCPFWIDCFGVNFSRSLDSAIEVANRHKNKVVKEL
jgi:hypothetical protein